MDYTFQNGFISAKSTSLLTDNDYQELVIQSKESFIELLKLKNYGYVSSNKDLDMIIKDEKTKMHDELNSMIEQSFLKEYIALKHDITNILMIYKTSKLNLPKGEFDDLGQLTEIAISKALMEKSFDLLSPFWQDVFQSFLEIEDQNNYQTVLVDIANQVVLKHLIKIKDKSLVHHFKLSADIKNILIMLKSLEFSYSFERIKDAFSKYGYIDVDQLTFDQNLTIEGFKAIYESSYFGKISELIQFHLTKNDYFGFEMALYDFLLDELSSYQVEPNNASMIISYVIKKEIEAILIKRAYLKVKKATV